jgi:hypothetical protein
MRTFKQYVEADQTTTPHQPKSGWNESGFFPGEFVITQQGKVGMVREGDSGVVDVWFGEVSGQQPIVRKLNPANLQYLD